MNGLIIAAYPQAQITVIVIDSATDEIIERMKVWYRDLFDTIQMFSKKYRIDSVRIYGPQSYIGEIEEKIKKQYPAYEVKYNGN